MTHDDSQTSTPSEAVVADDTALAQDDDRAATEQPLVDHSMDGKLEGWGPNEGPTLSEQQATRLQEHDEPVAAGDFGGLLKGDQGTAGVADESKDSPQTKQPDTSLGHEGGSRYEQYAAGDGEQA